MSTPPTSYCILFCGMRIANSDIPFWAKRAAMKMRMVSSAKYVRLFSYHVGVGGHNFLYFTIFI